MYGHCRWMKYILNVGDCSTCSELSANSLSYNLHYLYFSLSLITKLRIIIIIIIIKPIFKVI